MGDRAFIASAPTLWNDLPLEIRMAKSVHIFKKNFYKDVSFSLAVMLFPSSETMVISVSRSR